MNNYFLNQQEIKDLEILIKDSRLCNVQIGNNRVELSLYWRNILNKIKMLNQNNKDYFDMIIEKGMNL